MAQQKKAVKTLSAKSMKSVKGGGIKVPQSPAKGRLGFNPQPEPPGAQGIIVHD